MSVSNVNIAARFATVTVSFNRAWLVFLQQLRGSVEPAPDGFQNDDEKQNPFDEEEGRHFEVLTRVYEKELAALDAEADSSEPAFRMYDAVGDQHERLLSRDETFVAHMLPAMYGRSNIDGYFLYDGLSDGSDPDVAHLDVSERDAKMNFWSSLVNMYRLACVITIYSRTPIIKDIMMILLEKNPGIASGGGANVGRAMFDHMLREYKNNVQFRRMFMKVFTSNNGDMDGVFESLQRVVTVFGDERTMEASAKDDLRRAVEVMEAGVSEVLRQAGEPLGDAATLKTVTKALDRSDYGEVERLVSESKLSRRQVDILRKAYEGTAPGQVHRAPGPEMASAGVEAQRLTTDLRQLINSAGDMDAFRDAVMGADGSMTEEDMEALRRTCLEESVRAMVVLALQDTIGAEPADEQVDKLCACIVDEDGDEKDVQFSPERALETEALASQDECARFSTNYLNRRRTLKDMERSGEAAAPHE